MNVPNVQDRSRVSGTLRFPAYAVAGLAGTSLKPQHLAAILEEGKQDGFFEVFGGP